MGRKFDQFHDYEPKSEKARQVMSAFAVLGLADWEAGYVAFTVDWASEALRCLKPGGFCLAFGGTRTADLMSMGFRIAGLEKLDEIDWIYLSGMSKAQDIGKMYDKREGAERDKKRIPYTQNALFRMGGQNTRPWMEEAKKNGYHDLPGDTPATDLAKQWDGWKTPSLKPSHEPCVLARKPLIGTYCENIEEWGVGAINVEACRVPIAETLPNYTVGTVDSGVYEGGYSSRPKQFERAANDENPRYDKAGRFPANTVLVHAWGCTEHQCVERCPVRLLDEQSGVLTSGFKPATTAGTGPGYQANAYGKDSRPVGSPHANYGDTGGASKVFAKFFYEEEDFVPFRYRAKASGKDRNAGCEHLPRGNDMPTVKPSGLIRYLQRLCTPPGGTTASPFLGSGTDAVAAIHEGFRFWGMNLPDREGEEYWPIIEARVAHAQAKVEEVQAKATEAASLPQQARLLV